MPEKSNAFSEPIPNGLIRILLTIHSVKTQIRNDAPDFIDPISDKPFLKIAPIQDISALSTAFEKSYPLKLDKQHTKGELVSWKLEQEGIWFDIPMDNVKDVWLAEFNFFIESEKSRYLLYHIENVEHTLEWLQQNQDSEVFSLSTFKKEFIPPRISAIDTYSGQDIMKCTDMIGRAVQKIDIRTRTAMVKFNTDNGRLESLIIGMADQLGYKIKALDNETIASERNRGGSVSHQISLK